MAPSRCPTCGKPVPMPPRDRTKYFPFCSERCQLVDLGRWFDGQYRISTDIESPDQTEELFKQQNDQDAEPNDESE